MSELIPDIDKALELGKQVETNTTNIATNTSSIATLSSGKLNLSGGNLTGSFTVTEESNAQIRCQRGDMPSTSSAPTSNTYAGLNFYDGSNANIGFVRTANLTTGVETELGVINRPHSAQNMIKIGYDNNGNVYTGCPTPATTDNSTRIATTAYVKAQKTLINTSTTITSSTTLTYTGASVTIPANSYFAFFTQAMFSSAAPQEILISTNSTAHNPYQTVAYSSNGAYCSFCGYQENATTYYIWAKYSSATSNPIKVRGWYETK